MLEKYQEIAWSINTGNNYIDSDATSACRLSDMSACYVDGNAVSTILTKSNPVIYRQRSLSPGSENIGQQCSAISLLPGLIGAEYHMTRGHFNNTPDMRDWCIGLRGIGVALLEDYQTGEIRLAEFSGGKIVFVPGMTACRIVNTGNTPLVFINVGNEGDSSAYDSFKKRNLRKIIIAANNGRLQMINRAQYRGRKKSVFTWAG